MYITGKVRTDSMTSYLQARKKYEVIETKYNLFEQELQEFRFWDYLRFPVWSKILQETGTTDTPHRRPVGGETKLSRRIRILNSFVFYNPLLAGKYDYLFIGSSRRKLDSDGTYTDPYCDPVIEFLGKNRCLLLERPYCNTYFSPRRTANIAHIEAFSIYRRIKRMKISPPDLTDSELDFLKTVATTIANEYNLADFSLRSEFERSYYTRQYLYPVALKLLKKISPKAVFLVCSYGNEPFIEACKSENIPAIELQHGILGPYHPGYSYPNTGMKKSFPDYFFSFGKFWEDNSSLPLPDDKIFTIGFPYFTQEQSRFSRRKKKNIVLFISQGTVGAPLSRFAADLESYLPDGWKIIYKLHPGEVLNWKTHYPWLLKSNIQVISDESPPLYQLMAEAKIQIGVNSTALIEGLAFNCRTFIIKLPGFEYMQTLLDSKLANLIETVEEFTFESSNPPFIETNYFFADHWEQNLTAAINQLVAR